MIHEILPVGMLECNCSIVGDERTGEAVVIDPGDEIERIEEILKRHKLTPKFLIATHAHMDHIGGLARLQQVTGAAVMMHEADWPMFRDLGGLGPMFGFQAPPVAEVSQFLKSGDRLRWGGLELEVMHTPGHSPGSLSLYMPGDERRIFSGDTLFEGSIGRTDLWGGSYREILQSIRQHLLAFPDETPVFPGHGPATTIGRERETNPFLIRG
jgi:hydroxyacylglutathione hydrolase